MRRALRYGTGLLALLLVTGSRGCGVWSWGKEAVVILEEVIPDGKVVSETDGIVEYRHNRYILGTHDLARRMRLIHKLKLADLPGPAVIDMRYDSQVIIRAR